MFVMLKTIGLAPDIDEAQRCDVRADLERAGALPDVDGAWLTETLPRGVNDGDLLWRVRFNSESAYRDWLCSRAVREGAAARLKTEAGITVDGVTYNSGWGDRREPEIGAGIWRALIFSVAEGTPPPVRAQFEQELMLMPRYVNAIRNWSLSRVIESEGARRWTHVWEQEFHDMAGLEGDYMLHPIHWGLVDGWFDIECPHQIVDPVLIHTVGRIDRTIMS
jgi:hypothetical protein